MKDLPDMIYSGEYDGGHCQGIAVDTERGFVYYSFTTLLVKTDLKGKEIGSVVNLAGHLGCIVYDAERNMVYGSLELKHDDIGAGIIGKTGWDPSEEDSFYLVAFDCGKIRGRDINAETGDVMKAVYLKDVVEDYKGTDPVSRKKHRYGCSGIDGTALGPVFGKDKDSEKKIMVAYGIYGDTKRKDNDYQVILEYDRSIFEKYGRALDQEHPHHSGPENAANRYFFYTGNTVYGIQNLEYDPFTGNWFVCVYTGGKEEFENFPMFAIDGKKEAALKVLEGRGGEKGLTLTSSALGKKGKQPGIYGIGFPYGQTGMAALKDGLWYFSHDFYDERTGKYGTHVYKYVFSEDNEDLFVPCLT